MRNVRTSLGLAAIAALLVVGAGRADDTAPVEVLEAKQTGAVMIADGMR